MSGAEEEGEGTPETTVDRIDTKSTDLAPTPGAWSPSQIIEWHGAAERLERERDYQAGAYASSASLSEVRLGDTRGSEAERIGSDADEHPRRVLRSSCCDAPGP